jgi:hypothetical protein
MVAALRGSFTGMKTLEQPSAAMVAASAGCSWERKMTSQMPRLIAIGLLALTIATGAAQAAPRNNQVRPPSQTASFVSRLRHWVVVLITERRLPPGSSSTSIQPKEAGVLDPNGLH